MSTNPSTADLHKIRTVDARRRQIRLMQVILAGAATVATLALFGPAQPGGSAVASGPTPAGTSIVQNGGGAGGGRVIAVDDNDQNNPSSGDIFTQNAQDQSTASGAGT
ncbi:Mycobacterium numidiamassiliense ORFan [Mycobacterium numidiamassiliense]|uniref:Mycobacterium numidiamassiliense ORFan n=1 Tax=Mycobacterium numidiamassiliense TaxID=1841861 RepID=A0A2U3P9X8_9MYCO|nr:hypothetical protein [Mycobacterium numidiamassiliense]SPM40495.1 Mycobacterium numidiamassiliense ORFan [Mycobacterium numidiamassiliense]